MAMRRTLSAALGSLALLSTAATTAIQIVLAACIYQDSPGHSTAIAAAMFEGLVLVILGWCYSTHFCVASRELSARHLVASLMVSLLAITVAMAISVATIVYLCKTPISSENKVLGSNQTDFLVGSSVVVGISFALQLLFTIAYFALMRAEFRSGGPEDQRRAATFPIKSIPYSQTTANLHWAPDLHATGYPSYPSSLCRSATGTVSSMRSSLSNVIRPVTSRTRLLSLREKRRTASIDSIPEQNSAEDTFESWDTSTVDEHNRQTVLEASSPIHAKHGFLETIPASPLESRTPSRANGLEGDELSILEPPPPRRSFSSSRSSLRRDYTEHESTSELHIHPLFRSDSPTPPPVATPGTVVLASPIAGQIISARQSVRSLSRMRSGSISNMQSPLSREGSVEPRQARDNSQVGDDVERKMTPPIPEWILEAGSRTSLAAHQARQ